MTEEVFDKLSQIEDKKEPEYKKPNYKISIDDFFKSPEDYFRAIECTASWQAAILCRCLSRMGKQWKDGQDGKLYSTNVEGGYTSGCRWGLGSGYQTVKSWCYDNCGGCGSRDWYMKPRFHYYVERTHMRPSYQAKFPAYPGYVEKFDGGYVETMEKCLAKDYRKCTMYDFDEVDLSKYLMPTEVEEYKEKCEIDPMIGAEPLKKPHPWNYNRVKPSEFKGTEDEQYKKERLRWQIHPRNNSTSVYDFWQNGFYGLIGIECDKPWKSKFLAEVFRRMGQHTGQFKFDHSEPKIYTPSEYIGVKPEKIVPFNELNMTDYLTLEEMEKLVDKVISQNKDYPL